MLKEVQSVVFNGKIVKPLNLYRTLSRKYTVLRFVEAVKGGGNLNDADCPTGPVGPIFYYGVCVSTSTF
jgi:hypothetical protein